MSGLMYESASSLWIGEPIILASKSLGRARILEGAGIPFKAIAADFDERALEANFSGSPEHLAQTLADEKARVVSEAHPDRFVLGGDQVLAIDDEVLHKAPTEAAAIEQLMRLSGCAHRLHSAISIARNGKTHFANVSSVTVKMLPYTRDAIVAYVRAAGRRVLDTVGGYEIEGLGVNLIESIDGDFFTVVGLPILPVLGFFRREGFIAGWEARP